jgi:hypothetical protein
MWLASHSLSTSDIQALHCNPHSFMNLFVHLLLHKWATLITCSITKSAARSLTLLMFLLLIQSHDFFSNLHSGGWSPNWVHSARRPLTGLLYLPRVIVRMEYLVEWMAGETEVLGENLPRRYLVHHKSHLTRPGIEPGPPRWEASY